MADPLCRRCARPDPTQGYCCPGCAVALIAALHQAADLIPEMQTTVARLDVVAHTGRVEVEADQGRNGNALRPTPLLFDWDAAENAWAIANTLGTWARHVSEERGEPIDDLPARYLAEKVEWLRHRPEAEPAFDELHHACALLRHTIDAPPPRWYAGRCPCGEDLYPHVGADVIRCRECGGEWDAAARKEQLLRAARDQLAYAELLARAATALDAGPLDAAGERRPVTPAMVRGYAARHRLIPHGHDALERPLYRVGDLLDLLATLRPRVAA